VSVRHPTATLEIWDNENEVSREKWAKNSLNFNVNSTNLVHVVLMYGYKLPITGQKLAQKGLV